MFIKCVSAAGSSVEAFGVKTTEGGRYHNTFETLITKIKNIRSKDDRFESFPQSSVVILIYISLCEALTLSLITNVTSC